MTGVIAQKADGGYVHVNAAKGVILCCGGYLGITYLGNAAGRSITFGRHAGRHAALNG